MAGECSWALHTDGFGRPSCREACAWRRIAAATEITCEATKHRAARFCYFEIDAETKRNWDIRACSCTKRTSHCAREGKDEFVASLTCRGYVRKGRATNFGCETRRRQVACSCTSFGDINRKRRGAMAPPRMGSTNLTGVYHRQRLHSNRIISVVRIASVATFEEECFRCNMCYWYHRKESFKTYCKSCLQHNEICPALCLNKCAAYSQYAKTVVRAKTSRDPNCTLVTLRNQGCSEAASHSPRGKEPSGLLAWYQ